MKNLHFITFILLIIGGINWGLLGLFGWEIGMILPGIASTILYTLIGVAAFVELFAHKKDCKKCGVEDKEPGSRGDIVMPVAAEQAPAAPVAPVATPPPAAPAAPVVTPPPAA